MRHIHDLQQRGFVDETQRLAAVLHLLDGAVDRGDGRGHRCAACCLLPFHQSERCECVCRCVCVGVRVCECVCVCVVPLRSDFNVVPWFLLMFFLFRSGLGVPRLITAAPGRVVGLLGVVVATAAGDGGVLSPGCAPVLGGDGGDEEAGGVAVWACMWVSGVPLVTSFCCVSVLSISIATAVVG